MFTDLKCFPVGRIANMKKILLLLAYLPLMLAAVFGLLVGVFRLEYRELDSNNVSNVVETINRRVCKCLVSAIVERKCTFSWIIRYENTF